MGVTNQQLADLMEQIVTSTDKHTAAFVEASTKQTDAFIQAVDRLIQNDNAHHEAFRRRLEDLALAQAHITAESRNNTEFRKQVGKYILLVILVPIGTLILNLIIK